MYCVIKCVKTKRVLKRKFASSVFHNCNAKTQICVTGRQSVKQSKELVSRRWELRRRQSATSRLWYCDQSQSSWLYGPQWFPSFHLYLPVKAPAAPVEQEVGWAGGLWSWSWHCPGEEIFCSCWESNRRLSSLYPSQCGFADVHLCTMWHYFCPGLLKFELHMQKPLNVKFYAKRSLVPKLLCVYQQQCALCRAAHMLLCLQYTVTARWYSCLLHTNSSVRCAGLRTHCCVCSTQRLHAPTAVCSVQGYAHAAVFAVYLCASQQQHSLDIMFAEDILHVRFQIDSKTFEHLSKP
jgi:hypothetical protein